MGKPFLVFSSGLKSSHISSLLGSFLGDFAFLQPPIPHCFQSSARVPENDFPKSTKYCYFQYGRYLLIASSHPGGLPANLQGVWNEHIEAPWNSDYHANINLQMNYWPAEVTGLSELHAPLFDFVDSLRIRGRKTARDQYDMDGFVVHHTTDAWRFTSAIGLTRWGCARRAGRGSRGISGSTTALPKTPPSSPSAPTRS